MLSALAEVGDLLADRVQHPAEHSAIVQASPELQERGRTKFAEVTGALGRHLSNGEPGERPPPCSRQSAPPSSGPPSIAGRGNRDA